MSWIKIAKPVSEKKRRPAVTMSASIKFGRGGACVTIAVRCDELPHGKLIWWRPGATVAVAIGVAEHRGALRIEPSGSGPFKLVALGRVGSLPGLRPPLPNGMAPQKQKKFSVEYDYSDGWLEITLPAWACPTDEDAPAPVRKAPFRIGQQKL